MCSLKFPLETFKEMRRIEFFPVPYGGGKERRWIILAVVSVIAD